jgi:oligosaccharide repeat unit polymerase
MADTMLFVDVNLGLFLINFETPKISLIFYIITFFLISDFKFTRTFLDFDWKIVSLLILLLLSAFISVYFNVERKTSFKTFLNYSSYFICFIITLYYASFFKEARNFIIKSFFVVNGILVISCLLDFYVPSFNLFLINNFGHSEIKHSFFEANGIKYLRPSGLLSETNLTGLSISLSLLLIIINYSKISNKALCYSYILLSGFAFGMLGSRSASIMIILCSLLLIFLRKVNYKTVLKVLAVFFLVQLLTPQTRIRIEQMFDKERIEEEASIGRFMIWKGAVAAFKENPLMGLGPGMFFFNSLHYIEKTVTDRESFEKMEKNMSNPHNIFLAMASEQGVIGLLLFMSLLMFILISFFKDNKPVSLSIFVGLVFVSALSSYAPYFKYYLILCIITYVLSKNEFALKEERVDRKS